MEMKVTIGYEELKDMEAQSIMRGIRTITDTLGEITAENWDPVDIIETLENDDDYMRLYPLEREAFAELIGEIRFNFNKPSVAPVK